MSENAKYIGIYLLALGMTICGSWLFGNDLTTRGNELGFTFVLGNVLGVFAVTGYIVFEETRK